MFDLQNYQATELEILHLTTFSNIIKNKKNYRTYFRRSFGKIMSMKSLPVIKLKCKIRNILAISFFLQLMLFFIEQYFKYVYMGYVLNVPLIFSCNCYRVRADQ